MSLPENLQIERAIFSTLSFFSLFQVPLSQDKVFLYLYKQSASLKQVGEVLEKMVLENKIFSKNGLYALKAWPDSLTNLRQQEAEKRYKKVRKFLWLLSLVPFVREASLINSMAIGNIKKESDIDFFIIVRPGFLYFARTFIILLFHLFFLYKTKNHIKEKFCFGFYISTKHLNLEDILIQPTDPYTAFWLASMKPLFGKKEYVAFIKANPWVFEYLPNFTPTPHFYGLIKKPFGIYLRFILEIIFYVPAFLVEPLLKRIHIRHTFNLPENHWPTATTIAKSDILKLHALDPRAKIRDDFYKVAESCLEIVMG
jgi:hypothetical protein